MLFSWLIIVSYVYKQQISKMVGMVIAMTLAMVVGLGVGSLAAMLFPSSFFEITMLSMLIGGFVGVTVGFPYAIVAILDGLISGFMGGMMGTMLGAMIALENQNQLLHIIGLICVGIFFLVYLLQLSEIKSISTRVRLLMQPSLYFVLICLFLYSFHDYSFERSVKEEAHKVHEHVEEIVIHADDYHFSPEKIEVSQNEEVTFTLVNDGLEEHDFEIKELGYHLHAMPNDSNSQAVTFTKPGIYEVLCTLPGHKEAGMAATVVVVES